MTADRAELHVHIEGTLEPEMVGVLARRNGIQFPAGHAVLRRPPSYTDLQQFLDAYYMSMSVLCTAEDFFDLAHSYLTRAHRIGVVHAEVFFDPQVHLGRGVPLEAVIEGLEAAAVLARADGMTVGWIACAVRHLGPEAAFEMVRMLAPHRHLLTGVGLDSTELGFPCEQFERAFTLARSEGYRVTVHAGEEDGPANVRAALDRLGAERIDHGIRSIEDPDLVARLIDDQIPLTVCPLSNVALRVVDSMKHHPLPRLLRAGVLVSVHSDDPAYFGGYLDANEQRLHEMGLEQMEIDQLAENSLKSVFLVPAGAALKG